MSESYVYIDAPSLDNSDQSKLKVNNEFQFVEAGTSDKGVMAQFPLYQKFLGNEWSSSLDYQSLGRTEFKPGLWAQQGEEISAGGDYAIGNTFQIYSRVFQVGNLKQLRVRFFDKNSINREGRNSTNHPAQITNYETLVPRLALFQNEYYDDDTVNSSSDYILKAFANYTSTSDNGAIYTLQEDFLISGKALNTLNYCYLIVALPDGHDWSSLVVGQTYSHGALRSLGNNASSKQLGFRSVPRGSLDNRSYICATPGTIDGYTSGQPRLLDFDFLIDVDLIDEYIGSNSKNHHLDVSEVVELNKLRYSAPVIDSSNKYIRKTTIANKIFVSDYSLTRGGNINLDGKTISYIQIPFQYTVGQSNWESSNLPVKNLVNYERQIKVALGRADGAEPAEEDYIISDNILAYSSFTESLIYQVTFNKEKGFKYNGHGIWIKGAGVGGGSNNFGVHYYIKADDNTRYAYNNSDKIDSNGTLVSCTPQVDIIFDYKTRKDWFDYIENKTSNLTSSGGNSSIFVNSISLGDWRIAVNAEGNLEIYHISATEDKDKSIFYIPSSN